LANIHLVNTSSTFFSISALEVFLKFFRLDNRCVGVGMSCIWKNVASLDLQSNDEKSVDVKSQDFNSNKQKSYDVVDKVYDVLAWHNVAAEIAAEHPNPLERHLVKIQ
jgi:hypothetical protein